MKHSKTVAMLATLVLVVANCEPTRAPVAPTISEDFATKPPDGTFPAPGNGVAAAEIGEICKYGSSANFHYTVTDRTTGASTTSTITVADGDCEVLVAAGGMGVRVSITEDPSSGYVLDSVIHQSLDSTGVTSVTLPGSPNPTIVDSATGSVKDGSGQKILGVHGFEAKFYNHTTQGQIGDFVWNDLNDNGIQDAGEPGIGGQTVTLSGTVNATTTTDASGHYLFSNLPAGNYTVTVATPATFGSSPSDQGSDTTVDSDGSPASVTLPTNSSVNLAIDFGFAPTPPPPPPCPAGSFSYSFNAAGDLNIVYDQFPAPNDNSYGVNAIGWPNGHKFSDLTGSDHAGFQLVDGAGVVQLSFNVDYISADLTAPSGYASLGVTGGDGKMLVGTASGISATSSLAKNLNNVNIPGLFNASHVQQFGSVNLLVNSPPTDASHLTYNNSDPLLAGWDFHDTYFVTISAAKLASLGFNASTWQVLPNASQLHNSPAKPCPTPAGVCALVTTRTVVKDKQVQLTIANNGNTDVFLSDVLLTWPALHNGKLMQVKLDGDVVYDKPDIAGGSAHLTLAQLVADPNHRKIQHGRSRVLTFVFEKNADATLANYTGTFTFGTCVITLGP